MVRGGERQLYMQILTRATNPCVIEIDHEIHTDRLPRISRSPAICESLLQTTPISVLLIDEREVLRQGICALLREHDFMIAGQTAQIEEALAIIHQNRPDLILLATQPGLVDGLDEAQQLLQDYPEIPLVLFNNIASTDHLFQALRLDIRGYLLQSLPLEHFLDALHAIHRGERVLNEISDSNKENATSNLPQPFSESCRPRVIRAHHNLNTLDVELVRLAAEGFSNQEIATHKHWNELAVKSHMQEIYRKLQVLDRAQAVSTVARLGLISV
jgi:NarL family two-component system response regulator LiaR